MPRLRASDVIPTKVKIASTILQQSILANPLISIKGIVMNVATGYPVAGVTVTASMDFPAAKNDASAANQAHRAVTSRRSTALSIGQSTTGADGRFTIAFTAEASVKQALVVLQQDPASTFNLELQSDAGKSFASVQENGGRSEYFVTLASPVPTATVTRRLWQQLGQRMISGHIVQIHQLARRLVAGAPPFQDWHVETRQAVLQQLELNFLDPKGTLRSNGVFPSFQELRQPGTAQKYKDTLGNHLKNSGVAQAFRDLTAKSESFQDIFSVDWLTDPQMFLKNKPGGAVMAFESLYDSDLGSAHMIPDLQSQLDSILHTPGPRSRYRDYLRTIYTGPTSAADYSTRLNKLRTRFHQDFETVDDDDQPANEVLIPIFKQILTASMGINYGLGKSGLPARGTMSARDYLDALISVSKLTAEELRLRYRVDFARPDSAVSSPVRENIAALQGFFADGFESPQPPHPLYEDKLAGKAPFFLEYDEWLQQTGPFYGENFYQVLQTFTVKLTPNYRSAWTKNADSYKGSDMEWIIDFLLAEDKMREGYKLFTQGEYESAQSAYDAAGQKAGDSISLAFQKNNNAPLSAWNIVTSMTDKLKTLKSLPMKSEKDLEAFMDFFVPPYFGGEDVTMKSETQQWIDDNTDTLKLALVHLVTAVLPVLRGDAALAAGDVLRSVKEYEKTTRFLMARADLTDSEGYDPKGALTWKWPTLIPDVGAWEAPALYDTDGRLPYTTPRFDTSDRITYEGGISGWETELMASVAKDWGHPMEQSFFRLRHGDALLAWADALYKTDAPGKIARAREVYKAVLWLHGDDPGVSPDWPKQFPYGRRYRSQQENPAVASQEARARLALSQIRSGLNFYGWNDSLVPTLRYRTLKDAADRFAATAKSAQQDFLLYMGKIEDAIRDGLVSEHMLKKAALQGQLAEEQSAVAKVNVDLAKHQVQLVKDAITAKEKEISDSEDFFNQLKTFVSGMSDALSGMPDWMTKPTWRGVQSAAGIQLSSDALLTGTAAGAAAMGGYGLFIYAGYTSLSSMGDAQNSLQHQLHTLQTQALPLAQEQLQARQNEVNMAAINYQIAQADAALAQALMTFQAERFLNTELWARLATVMKRVMQRFLDLGGRFAWLAERALAFEQDRTISIIRLNYFPQTLQGVTGADLLQMDLGELEAFRLAGLQQTVPVRRTFSLAFDFPLAFGQLKKTGACTFATQESAFQQAYPGTYGYRLQAVTVTAAGLNALAPARGLLSNLGVSTLSRSDGKTHLLLRNPDALPLSEFRLQQDMAVYGLPGETMMAFEGSGVETLWTLEFPAAANPQGLAAMADVQITFDLRATFSSNLYSQQKAAPPATVQRMLILSAQTLQPQALADLQGNPSKATFAFDVAALKLPATESQRKVVNVVLFLAGAVIHVKATMATVTPAGKINFSFDSGVALSNAPPLKTSGQASPLNALAGRAVDQTFTLVVDKSQNTGVDFSGVKDVVLGIEYTADLK